MALTETRQQGERKREEWLADFAKRSIAENWTTSTARRKAELDVLDAELVGHLKTEKAVANAINEGMLAAHPDVRNHFARLLAVRDELWKIEPDYLREKLHGPSQILVELLRRQKKRIERHHTESAAAFLRYLREDRFYPG